MKDILSHLPNDGLEGPESFVLVFFYMAFCFYIYGSLQVVSCDPWQCFDAAEIR